MLILQRKKEQSLVIGDDICITVLDVGSDWVKLAIDAPRDVSILRAELKEAAAVNQEAASQPLPPHSLSQIKSFINGHKNSGHT